MFRVCISFLVTAGLLAGNLAAIPHSHGLASVSDRQQHSVAPHFHLRWWNNLQGNSFDYDPGSSYRTGPSKVANRGTPGASILNCSGLEHDADAIYLPNATSPKDFKTQKSFDGQHVAEANSTILLSLLSISNVRHEMKSPRPSGDAAILYFCLKNLRI